MFNSIPGGNVLNVLPNNDYASLSVPSNSRNAQSHNLLRQAENSSQGGQSQFNSYAEVLGAYEYCPPRWESNFDPSLVKIGQSSQVANHILQQPFSSAAKTINSGSIRQVIDQFLSFPDLRLSTNKLIKTYIKEGAKVFKNMEGITDEDFQFYIEESILILDDVGVSESVINKFVKNIEIILYGEIKLKKFDSTKYTAFKDKYLPTAIMLKYKKSVTLAECEAFHIEIISKFKEEGASASAVEYFSVVLHEILNDKKEIERGENSISSDCKEEIIINFINLKKSGNFTEEKYKMYINLSLSLLHENGALLHK